MLSCRPRLPLHSVAPFRLSPAWGSLNLYRQRAASGLFRRRPRNTIQRLPERLLPLLLAPRIAGLPVPRASWLFIHLTYDAHALSPCRAH